MSNRYTIEIIADAPPRLCLGDVIAGGQIVGINCANDEPVSEPKEKTTLSGEKKVASDLMKLISGMTLDNVNDVRAELYAAQAQLSEATFNQLDAVLESNLEALTQA